MKNNTFSYMHNRKCLAGSDIRPVVLTKMFNALRK
ncbi:hypothetical protein T4D_14179, partial [Trichinella pseudospiralis]